MPKPKRNVPEKAHFTIRAEVTVIKRFEELSEKTGFTRSALYAEATKIGLKVLEQRSDTIAEFFNDAKESELK